MNPVYKNAIAQYKYNWKNALFSSLGILIASMALVISGHLMQMATKATLDNFKNMGGNTLTMIMNGQKDISMGELNDCLSDIPFMKQYYPFASAYLQIQDQNVPIIGSVAQAESIFKFNITDGRSLHSHDQQPFAIITKDMLDQLNYQVSDQVLLDQGVIEIIGISDTYELPMLYYYNDGFIFVSQETFSMLFPNISMSSILIEVDKFENMDIVASAASSALEAQFPEMSFTTINPYQMVKMTQMTVMMVNGLIYLVVSICAVLGGIGIMNMTIANITARNLELALRVSFGATIKEIQTMLMIETAILCSISAFIGALFGVAGVKIVAYCMKWSFVFAPSTLLYSQLFAVITGVCASQYPANIIRKIPIADVLKGK
jgi:ABC-type antimicrobial peptide transport system permease subunit